MSAIVDPKAAIYLQKAQRMCLGLIKFSLSGCALACNGQVTPSSRGFPQETVLQDYGCERVTSFFVGIVDLAQNVHEILRGDCGISHFLSMKFVQCSVILDAPVLNRVIKQPPVDQLRTSQSNIFVSEQIKQGAEAPRYIAAI